MKKAVDLYSLDLSFGVHFQLSSPLQGSIGMISSQRLSVILEVWDPIVSYRSLDLRFGVETIELLRLRLQLRSW